MTTPLNNPRREATMGQDTPSQPVQGTLRTSYAYKEIHALILCWEEDDLGCEAEALRLKGVFDDRFHITSTRYVSIPSTQPYGFVESELCDFKRDHSCKENLLIVYYGGHGGLDEYGRMTWSPYSRLQRGVDVPRVEWYALQLGLERAISDVVILLDSCMAAGSISSSSTYSKEGGTSELLGACGYDAAAPGPGVKSFSHALIEEFEAFALKRRIFSVADLHQRVLANVVRQDGDRARARLGNDLAGLVDPCATPRATTPVFVRLTGDSRAPSIALKVLPRRREAVEQAIGNMTLGDGW